MKKITIMIIAGFILSGCKGNKEPENPVLNEVMKAHDKVMGEDGQLMKNKMLLDSMVKHNSAGDIKDSVNYYLNIVNLADGAMDNWMHNFNPDLTGKPQTEQKYYLDKQKKMITLIDIQMNSAIEVSDKYLTKMKMK